jgi:hypothetical protein
MGGGNQMNSYMQSDIDNAKKQLQDYFEGKHWDNGIPGEIMVYTPSKRPPLGLTPKYIRNSQRIEEIHKAIIRYTEAHYVIPIEWIEEYNELIKGIE